MEKDKKHLYKDFIKNAKITLKYSKNYKGTLLIWKQLFRREEKEQEFPK